MKLSLFLLSIFSYFSLHPQSLLVNGGFEDVNICTEYLAKCAPEGWVSTGNGISNYVKNGPGAYEGEYYFAVQAGNRKRSFIRSQLLCGLRAGHRYELLCYVRSPYPILDSIGIYFTAYDFLYERTRSQDIKPSTFLAEQGNRFITNDTGWQKVKLIYTAKGDENYLTIGNFSKNEIDAVAKSKMAGFLVYVDAISFTPLDKAETLCNDWQKVKEDIYDQNERHQYLDRLVKMNRNEPSPKTTILSKTAMVIVDTLLLPDILFESGKAALQPGSFVFLDSIGRQGMQKKIDSIVIKGHTDNTGTVAGNEQLSADRAKSVADYLAPRISRKRIAFFIYGMADRVPVASNTTPQGKQKNRRVEILIYFRE